MNSLNRIQTNPTAVEITALMRLAEETANARLQPGVTLNSVPGADEFTVVTDPRLLGQVMMNLLANACKFTTKGSITFGYELYEDEIYFFVKDTGAGLEPMLKDRLGDLFEGDGTDPAFNTPGVGMGLPVSTRIVKRLGGSIGVESRGPGRGATFWFTIPLQEPEAPAAPAPSPSAQPTYAQPAAAAPKRERPLILVAEDNPSNFLLFQSILKRKYDIVHAEDGLEAVSLFKQTNPDLILMDINMPNMDGYQAVREIRKLDVNVPVIAVTAYAFVTDRERILENGFNGYVSKPINMMRLDQEINNCLAR